jgi:hypothetical protein
LRGLFGFHGVHVEIQIDGAGQTNAGPAIIREQG